jgi:hypothetical protein
MPAFGLLGIDFGHGLMLFQGKQTNGWKPISLLDNNFKKIQSRFSNTMKL